MLDKQVAEAIGFLDSIVMSIDILFQEIEKRN